MVETETATKSVASMNLRSEAEGTAVVEVVDPRATTGWNAAVAEFRASTVFHTDAWASVLTETYNYEPVYFVERGSATIDSVLPVVSVSSPFTGKRGVSLPFTDFCPVLAKASDSPGRLFRAAVEHGRRQRWRYLECRGGQRPAPEARPSVSFVEHLVELADDDTSARRCRSEVRTAIRKAKNSEVQVSVERSLDGVKSFYSLHCRTRRKHGVPPQPFSFFKNLHKYLLRNDFGSIFLAYSGKIPVAGAIFLHFTDHVVYKFGASNPSFQHLRANNSIFWEAIRFYYRQGYRVLSLGRSSSQDLGLRRFKRGWGAEEREIPYFRFDLKTSRFTECDAAAGWSTCVFSHLPVRLNRWLGGLLYKHMG